MQLSKTDLLIELIEEEALTWYSRYGTPPRFTFVAPKTFTALLYEAHISGDKYDVGFRELQIVTSVGALKVKADVTIDDVNVAFVSSDENSNYADYITEKIFLGVE